MDQAVGLPSHMVNRRVKRLVSKQQLENEQIEAADREVQAGIALGLRAQGFKTVVPPNAQALVLVKRWKNQQRINSHTGMASTVRRGGQR
jgi:hypothetical protein